MRQRLHRLSPDAGFDFPPVELATPEGLLAVGGDLQPGRLLNAYRHGIFPWYSDDQPILWWSPDPRAVLFPDKLRVTRSLRKTLRAGRFTATLDTAFHDVISACAEPRPGSGGTWITPEMIEAYVALHHLGYAHSVEVRHDGQLVGGLYGLALGGTFCGESMFSRATDASKVAFVHLAYQLQRWTFSLIDCQLPTAHLTSLGAEEMPRQEYLHRLEQALTLPERRGVWQLDADLADGSAFRHAA